MERFFAKDMKTALVDIKEALGPDAIIVSNQKVAGGVEVMATADPATPTPISTPSEDSSSPIKSNLFPPSVVNSLDELLSRQKNKTTPPQKISERTPKNALQSALKKSATKQSTPAPDYTKNIAQELKSLRSLLEHQVANLMWQDVERISPVKAHMIAQLKVCGFPEAVADQLTQSLPEKCDAEGAYVAIEKYLKSQIHVAGDEIIQEGGIVTLLGPTGAGKTTTISKLAARFAMRFGPQNVALISCDNYRIGAYEQLHTFGKIIGCLVKKIDCASALSDVLATLSEKRLILIDTAGMGQRDQRLQQQLHELVTEIDYPSNNYLVLSATNQADVLRDTVDYFQRVPLHSVILTKMDESLSMGGALGVCLEKGLDISYVTDGQRVPEDIHIASQEQLVCAAFHPILRETKQPYFWQENEQSCKQPSILSEE